MSVSNPLFFNALKLSQWYKWDKLKFKPILCKSPFSSKESVCWTWIDKGSKTSFPTGFLFIRKGATTRPHLHKENEIFYLIFGKTDVLSKKRKQFMALSMKNHTQTAEKDTLLIFVFPYKKKWDKIKYFPV